MWLAGGGESGSECTFLPNGAKIDGPPIAIKLYFTWRECHDAHRRQAIAYKHKLAPLVGRMFSAYVYSATSLTGDSYKFSQERFGYFTSMALCPIKGADESKMYDVSYKLDDLAIGGRDAWYANYGYWKGRVVCVDFGENSAK